MHTMTLDEVRNLPPLSEEEIENVMSFNNTDFSDCPKQTKDELAKFRPWHEVHNCPTNSAKTNVNINIPDTRPIILIRSSSRVECSMSIFSIRLSSKNTRTAISNDTPCFFLFILFLLSSHSKVIMLPLYNYNKKSEKNKCFSDFLNNNYAL